MDNMQRAACSMQSVAYAKCTIHRMYYTIERIPPLRANTCTKCGYIMNNVGTMKCSAFRHAPIQFVPQFHTQSIFVAISHLVKIFRFEILFDFRLIQKCLHCVYYCLNRFDCNFILRNLSKKLID